MSSTLRISVVSVISIVSASGSRPLSRERIFDVLDHLVGVELASGDVHGHPDRIALPLAIPRPEQHAWRAPTCRPP